MELTNLNDFVLLAGDKLVTDSRRVARHFGKRHDSVLRAFDQLQCSAEFNHHNFEAVAEPDAKGEMRRVIRMTKDGFVFLVMGFTGREAARIKEAYIGAFNTMAEQLQRRDLSLWQQMQALIAREVESKVRASFGSHLMLERKREIPVFRQELGLLESEIQPSLLLN